MGAIVTCWEVCGQKGNNVKMNVTKFYYDVLWVNWIVIGSNDFTEYIYEYKKK
jgi:hypothetical protein